ncbi:unnamed protein product [Oikopleura dioica]|uniref:Uncharacterized protein n=1 Tax=Oikopleura dioica TaxID=34765 RepID=E4X7T5_OIKDI|nr:unnamed protein product [Oikopleura dioica]
MSSRIENNENVNPTSMKLDSYDDVPRFSTRMMREDSYEESGFDYLTTKPDIIAFDRCYNGDNLQVDEYQHPPTVGFLNEKRLYAAENIEIRENEISIDILKEKNDDKPEMPRNIQVVQYSEICEKKTAKKKFSRNRIDPNENFLQRKTAKNENFKNMKKWLETVFQSIDACLESKKQQIENNSNLSQKEYNSRKKAQEKIRRCLLKEIREIKKLHTKKLAAPESLRDTATELLMRVYENEMKNQDGFYINTMPRIPDTENALINTSQHH